MVSNICMYIIYIFMIGNYRRLWLWLCSSPRLDGLLWWIMMPIFEVFVVRWRQAIPFQVDPKCVCKTFCFLIFGCLMTLGWRGRAFLFSFWWLIHSSSFGSHISSFPHITGTLTGLTNRRLLWGDVKLESLHTIMHVMMYCICHIHLYMYTYASYLHPCGFNSYPLKRNTLPKRTVLFQLPTPPNFLGERRVVSSTILSIKIPAFLNFSSHDHRLCLNITMPSKHWTPWTRRISKRRVWIVSPNLILLLFVVLPSYFKTQPK